MSENMVDLSSYAPSRFVSVLSDITSVLAMGAYPTDYTVVDLIDVLAGSAMPPDVVEVTVSITEQKINTTRSVMQGKFVTSQPSGPNGSPSGRINVTLNQFLPDGYVTLLWPSDARLAMSYGGTVFYPSGQYKHWGVRLRVSQLPHLVFTAKTAAAVCGIFAFTQSDAGFQKIMRARSSFVEWASSKQVPLVALQSSPLSYTALDTLDRPMTVKAKFPADGDAAVVAAGGMILIGNTLLDATDNVVSIVGHTAAFRSIYIDRHATISVFFKANDLQWQDVKTVLTNRTVVAHL